ncbi:MAG TPA: hypothetical protein VFQ13_08400 [Anaerolineales bacterium]|nr:hypothetical protein [Anaerolineales bacterium]
MELVERHSTAEIPEELTQDQEMIQLFKRLKSVKAEYPPNLMSARRAAFKSQIALGSRINVLNALRASIQNLSLRKVKTLFMPAMNLTRTALVVTVLMLVVFVEALLKNREQAFNSPSPQSGVVQSGAISTTSTGKTSQVTCKPGYLPPLCLVKDFDKSEDLSFLGNGIARPAVAKDTLPGYDGIHKPAHVNDGLYGPGASWVSNSSYSWIKIDLGKTITINTVAFGRDRLGAFNDRDPGQFVIAVALSDSVYADGNSSNDYIEYTEVFKSEQIGFDGMISGSETIQAQFGPVMARFVKIVFANSGTAVDEVEVFMAQSLKVADDATKEPKEDSPELPRTSPVTSTLPPTKTAMPVPTDTPVPTRTATPMPTSRPTDTAIPVPSNTPVPMDTEVPAPTNTPVPPPQPTDTSIPPTEPMDSMESITVPTEILTPVAGP